MSFLTKKIKRKLRRLYKLILISLIFYTVLSYQVCIGSVVAISLIALCVGINERKYLEI